MMKKCIIAIACLFSMMQVQAQSEKYIAAMQTNLEQIAAAYQNPEMFLKLANNFERIGRAEKSQWLPYYYAALMQVNHGFMQQDMTTLDPVADAADAMMQKADSLQPNNSELSCVKMMIATIRMLVNPQQRYMQYAPVIEANYQAAIMQDSSNPRPHYLKGENLKNTPEQFGGGCDAAKSELLLAQEKFSNFKLASPLMPNWGKERVDQLLEACK